MESNSFTPLTNPTEETRRLFRDWREKFVVPLLIGSVVLGIFVLIPAVNSSGSGVIKWLFITVYVLIGIVTAVRFSYNIRISVFLLSVYALGMGELFTLGILGDSIFFFISLVVFATMLLSPRAGIFTIVINILTFIVTGWLMLNGKVIPLNPYAVPAKIADWASAAGAIIMIGTIIIFGFQYLESAFFEAQTVIDTTVATLKEERNNLENSVIERTQQIRKVNNIGRAITAILDPDELLERAVRQISDDFDFYYTAIFLVNNTGQWADLKAATSDAGKILRENNHRFEVNGKSVVGAAIRTKQPQIINDKETNPNRFETPLLPYTRSQMVLPLTVGARTIGALEMHSTKEKAFPQQDIDAYQNMANQITIALENSRLFAEGQQSLSEMSATQQQYIEGAWLSLASDQKLEYEVGENESASNQELNIPLTLRDQIIGNINMANSSEWTPEQKNLIESIAAQAALALENARLVEESQSIATRERLVNDITSKVWASTTMDSILQTTVRELGRALEAAEVNIVVSMENDDE